MAVELVNLCLRVGSSGLTVKVSGNANSGAPADPPYAFRVFYAPEGQGTASSGEGVELSADSDVRVVAWDEAPQSIPEAIFEAPTRVDPSVEVLFIGEDFSLVSASSSDPWPPT